jgi:hypothetical protein
MGLGFGAILAWANGNMARKQIILQNEHSLFLRHLCGLHTAGQDLNPKTFTMKNCSHKNSAKN